MKTEKPAVIVFVRNPELGKVKTRIAKTEGDQKAYDIYIELLRHTRQVVSDLEVTRYLFYSEDILKSDDWRPELFTKLLQSNGNLGDRMKDAFKTCLSKHEKAIIIGSDCATLSNDHIKKAIDDLDVNDAVIGPTFDGGYYLLGAKSFHKELFENIDWSTEVVFEQTVEKIKKLELSHTKLDVLSDIDYIEDWEQWGWELPL